MVASPKSGKSGSLELSYFIDEEAGMELSVGTEVKSTGSDMKMGAMTFLFILVVVLVVAIILIVASFVLCKKKKNADDRSMLYQIKEDQPS
jgi:hypothetical protein